MSQTGIRNSNQYQQVPVKKKKKKQAVTFLRSSIRLPDEALTSLVSWGHDLAVHQLRPFPNSANFQNYKKKPFFFFFHPHSQPLKILCGFKLCQSTCGCLCGRVCISPPAAPGLHLIRPLFFCCPNRQALWVMNISQAAFQQRQLSMSVAVSSQWLWSVVLLHPKGVCAESRRVPWKPSWVTFACITQAVCVRCVDRKCACQTEP